MNVWADVFVNINKAYMAMLMTTPMVTLEVLVMGAISTPPKAPSAAARLKATMTMRVRLMPTDAAASGLIEQASIACPWMV